MSSRARNIGILIAGFLWVASTIGLGGQEPRPDWIPFKLTPRLAIPIVEASLNGSEGYPFLVDPSIPEVLLDTTLILGSGMDYASKSEVQEIDYFGDKEKVEVVYLRSLGVGDVTIQGIRALLVDGDDVTGREGFPSYGRIGREFLRPFRLTIYYPRKLLLLEPSPEGEVPDGGMAFDPDVPFVSVEAILNDTLTGRFVIDPGSGGTLLDKKWARDHKLADKGDKSAQIASVQFGGFTVSDVSVTLGEMKKLPYMEGTIGVLGAPVLRQLAITYDFPRGLLWLRRVGEEES